MTPRQIISQYAPLSLKVSPQSIEACKLLNSPGANEITITAFESIAKLSLDMKSVKDAVEVLRQSPSYNPALDILV